PSPVTRSRWAGHHEGSWRPVCPKSRLLCQGLSTHYRHGGGIRTVMHSIGMLRPRRSSLEPVKSPIPTKRRTRSARAHLHLHDRCDHQRRCHAGLKLRLLVLPGDEYLMLVLVHNILVLHLHAGQVLTEALTGSPAALRIRAALLPQEAHPMPVARKASSLIFV